MAVQLATKRIFLICLCVSVTASAALGLTAFFFQRSWFVQEELIFTAIFTGLYSLAALGASIPFDRGHWRVVSGVALAVIIFSFALTIPALWVPKLNSWEGFQRFVGVGATVGGLLAHMSLISMARVPSQFRWVQLLTLASVILGTSTILGVLILNPSYMNIRHWETVLYVCGLLTLCGSIVVPIAHVLNRVQTAEHVETVDLEMTIICPRCRLEQAVISGSSTCPRCKLRFKIEIEEPRCEKCGYLLYRLTANRCPECGESFERELVATDAGDEVSGT